MCPWPEPRDAIRSQGVLFLPAGPHGKQRWGNNHSKKDRGENKIMDHQGVS